ncbi:MAG: hypothetical protein ACJ790_13205 [Myxococcaceae bacterium]
MRTLLPVLLVLSCLFVPTVARAQQSATLLPKESRVELSGHDRWIQFAAGAAATIVAVPVGLLLGSAIGTTSNNYIVALIPAVLMWTLLPPVAATLAEWWTGNHLLPGSSRIMPALLVGIGVHLVVVVASILLFGVDAHSVLDVVLLTAGTALLLPTAITLSMMKWGPKPESAQVTWRERIGAPRLFSPTAAVSLGVPF